MKQYIKKIITLYFCTATTAMCQAEIDTITPPHKNPILQELLTPSSTKVFIAAHRGGYENDKVDKAPENSVVNIHNCLKKGYQLYETDIQRTKDGHFVMMHDPTITRETTGEGKASEMTLAELHTFHKRYRDLSTSPERIATFKEFLDKGKRHTIFKADMKRGVSKHFAEIMKLVTDHNALESIIFRVPYREVDLYTKYKKQGVNIAKHTLMFQVTSQQQIDDIKQRFNPSTIEIKISKKNPTNANTLDLIKYATAKGIIVETHAEGQEEDWLKLIEAGVRIFHTKTPFHLKKVIDNQ